MPPLDSDPQTHAWHVDRRVPLALLVAIGMSFGGQTLIGVWFASKMDSRIEVVEDKLAERTGIVDRYLATEADVRALRDTTIRIEGKVDRLIENGIPARRLPSGGQP